VIAPKAVHDGEASGNAKTRKPFTRRDDEHLVVIKQVTTQMVANFSKPNRYIEIITNMKE